MENFMENFTDVVRTSGVSVAFLLLYVMGDRGVWITADIVLSVGAGLALLLCPSCLLGFQLKADELNENQTLLLRTFGLMLMGSAVTWWRTRDTRDGTVNIALLMSRVCSCSVMLLCEVFVHWGISKGKPSTVFTHQHVYFGMVSTFLWLIGNLLQLIRSTDFSTYPQHNVRINTHLHLDALLIMLFSLAAFGFPDFILTTLFKEMRSGPILERHLVRLIAAQAMGSGIVAMQAPGFLHEKDKRSHFVSRIMNGLSMKLVLLGGVYVLGILSPQASLKHGIACLPFLINALVGYFAGTTINYRTHVHVD